MPSDFAHGREAVIDRKSLKKYTDRRSDTQGLLFLAGYFLGCQHSNPLRHFQ